MDKPDLDTGRQFIAANSPPGTILQCAVTGSHLYGFPSTDSDLDLKGIHITSLQSLLGLDEPKETFDRFQKLGKIECDYTSHEVKKALGLLLRGNGNILERILSPWQLVTGPEVSELQSLAQKSLSKKFFGHYHGFFEYRNWLTKETQRALRKAPLSSILCVLCVSVVNYYSTSIVFGLKEKSNIEIIL